MSEARDEVVGGGGGGGGGAATLTVAVAVRDPPSPLAVKVYVVELLGKTVRLPVACTGPTAGSIEISVALETDHRSVADWPRSIELGSPVN